MKRDQGLSQILNQCLGPSTFGLEGNRLVDVTRYGPRTNRAKPDDTLSLQLFPQTTQQDWKPPLRGPTRDAGWAGVLLAEENQAHLAEAPPRVHGKLMCCREHALNCAAGLRHRLLKHQPIPPRPSPLREAESGAGASEKPSVAWALLCKPLPVLGLPVPCLSRGPSGDPNGITVVRVLRATWNGPY